jgi:hypothetical protein
MISNMTGILCGTLINYYIILRVLLKSHLLRKSKSI